MTPRFSRRTLCAGLACLLLWPAPGRGETALPTPATGANLDESRVERVLYVDPANGEAADDDKHGTAEAPFATLRRACQAAAAVKDGGTGVKIVLANGTYRELGEIPKPAAGKQDTDAPLVIEAAERDQAIIDGADTEGWTPSTWKAENGRWTHPWPFVRGAAPRPVSAAASPVYRRGDLIFVNDTMLRQVNAGTELVPGSFWISNAARPVPGKRGEPSGAVVTVQPPEDAPLEGAVIQVGARPCGLTIEGRRNVVVRGLLFQHAADPKAPSLAITDMAGLSLTGCTNVLVEDVLGQWNDGAGVSLTADTDVTLRRVRTLHNSTLAVLAQEIRNLLAEDCEASFNNFRAEWAGFPNVPSYGAAVFASGDRLTWRRLHAVSNLCRGLTLSGGANVTVEESVFTNNLANGVLAYFCPGPLALRRCVVSGTKAYPNGSRGVTNNGGVVLTGSADVTLRSNIVAGNVTAQLALYEPLARPGKGRSERHTYRHNVFCGVEADQPLCKWLDGDNAKGPVVPDYRTLDTDENCFWNPALAEGFVAFTLASYAPGTSAAPETRHEQPGMNFDKWREWLAARVNAPTEAPEGKSLWQDPGFVNAAEGDFRLTEKSPVANWDLPSEEAGGSQ